jgi:hypothetical protein
MTPTRICTTCFLVILFYFLGPLGIQATKAWVGAWKVALTEPIEDTSERVLGRMECKKVTKEGTK